MKKREDESVSSFWNRLRARCPTTSPQRAASSTTSSKKKLRGVNQERYARMMFNKDKKMCEIAMVWDDGKFIMSFKHTRGQVNLMDESRENE